MFTYSTFCPHRVFMCFVWIWEQTAIISLYSINWLVFITETECVYCAVRTGSLYTASLTFSNSTFCPHSLFMCFVWIWEQTAIISLYSINWLVFITETECVYCAVRTGSLYIIQVKLNLLMLSHGHSCTTLFFHLWRKKVFEHIETVQTPPPPRTKVKWVENETCFDQKSILCLTLQHYKHEMSADTNPKCMTSISLQLHSIMNHGSKNKTPEHVTRV